MIDLAPQYLELVKQILAKHIFQAKVLVFGSRATGNAKKYSDLDLCLVSDSPLATLQLSALKEDFAKSDLPIFVDVVEWVNLSEAFQKIISEQSEEI